MAPNVDSEKARPGKEKEKPRDPADLRTSEETVAEEDNARVERTKSNGGVVGKVVSRPQIDHRTDGKVVLTEAEVYDELAVSFSPSKKWAILAVIFAIQCSMNMNAGIYASALSQYEERFNITPQYARLGQGLFLITYAIGCEAWAPFSEELGRWPIMQLSLFLVNIWNIPCILSPTFGGIIAGRILGGFSSAGGSVTLAYAADMFEPEDQGYPIAFIVFSSVGGSVLGPIVGGFQARFLGYRWNFILQLIFGAAVQAAHFFTPETKATVLVSRIAKRRRKAGQTNLYSEDDLKEDRWAMKNLLRTWARPFIMFATEPIVLCLSLLSGFSDALIFTFLEAFGPVFGQHGFGTIALGLAFIPIGIGYVIAWIYFIPWVRRDRNTMINHPEKFQPEQFLEPLLWTAPLLPIGLFGFAWTSLGPEYVHWIAPLIFSAVVGIANYAIYMATIVYMIFAYGPYSASATGGNGFARDFLAGIATFYAAPLYSNLGQSNPLEWASTLLAFLAILVAIPVYIFYWKGEVIRARSKFAVSLSEDRQAKTGQRKIVNEKNNTGV